jgi:MFS family permease
VTLPGPPPLADAPGPVGGGTLRSAMSNPPFRRIFAGTFASNVGTWMQNVTLIALAYTLTGDAWFVGLITFAQLGPMLFLSPLAGALADRADRRRIMVTVAVVQVALSLALAVVALDDSPNRLVLVLVVLGFGCAAAVNGPTAAATLPSLVPREDLQPAIAINSFSMNASRVAGPVLGGVVGSLGGASSVFVVNGATYLFVVAALMSVDVDFSPSGRRSERPLEQLRRGIESARSDVLVMRVLFTISSLSLCSLVFIYQMPLLAERQLGLTGWRFNLLFASFALGAALGALAMGSVLAHRQRATTTRAGLAVFAVALAVFATTRSVSVGFVSAFVCGACYFIVVTALATTLQMRVEDEVRGRVMGLWMMAWAGLVPLGGLIAGPVIDLVGISAVMLFGAVVAMGLAICVDLRDPVGRTASRRTTTRPCWRPRTSPE